MTRTPVPGQLLALFFCLACWAGLAFAIAQLT